MGRNAGNDYFLFGPGKVLFYEKVGREKKHCNFATGDKKPSSESSIWDGERRPIKKSGDGDIKTFLLAGKNNLIPARRVPTFIAFGSVERVP